MSITHLSPKRFLKAYRHNWDEGLSVLNGKTALDFAQENNNNEVVRVLESATKTS